MALTGELDRTLNFIGIPGFVDHVYANPGANGETANRGHYWYYLSSNATTDGRYVDFSKVVVDQDGCTLYNDEDACWDHQAYSGANHYFLSYPYGWLSSSDWKNKITCVQEGGNAYGRGLYRFFESCTNLKTVNIPKLTPGYRTFYGCTSLTKAVINSTTSLEDENYNYMDAYTFGNCTALKEVVVGSGASIMSHAFDGCSNLNVLNTEEIARVMPYAFYGCTSLHIEDLSNLGYADAHAFDGGVSVNVTSLAKLTGAGDYAFKDQTVLIDRFPEQLASTGEYAFYNTGIHFNILDLSQLTEKKKPALGDYSFCRNGITELILLGNGDFNPKAFDVLEKIIISPDTTLSADFTSLPNLSEIYWYGKISDSMSPDYIPEGCVLYVVEGTDADVFCEENKITHIHIDRDEVGRLPNISNCRVENNRILFDFDLGYGEFQQSGIHKVMLNNEEVSFEIVGNLAVLPEEFVQALKHGDNEIGVEFSNGYKTRETFQYEINEWISNHTIVRYADGVVTVSGIPDTDKKMENYSLTMGVNAPWYGIIKDVDRIEFIDGVTSVGTRAFSGIKTNTIDLGDTVEEIREEAFLGSECKALQGTSNVNTIHNRAFYNCDISDFDFPVLVTLGDYPFTHVEDNVLTLHAPLLKSFPDRVTGSWDVRDTQIETIGSRIKWTPQTLGLPDSCRKVYTSNMDGQSTYICYVSKDTLVEYDDFHEMSANIKIHTLEILGNIIEYVNPMKVYVPRGGIAEKNLKGHNTKRCEFIMYPKCATDAVFDKSVDTELKFECEFLNGQGIDSIEIGEIKFTGIDKTNRVKDNRLFGIPNGNYSAVVTYLDGIQDTMNVTIKGVSTDQAPSIAGEGKFDAKNPADIEYFIHFGSGILSATSIVEVGLKENAYTLEGERLTIHRDYLSSLKNGEYELLIRFDNNETVTTSFIVENSEVTDRLPFISGNVELDVKNPKPIEWNVDFGSGDYQATDISKVLVGDKELDALNYWIEDGTLIIDASALVMLKDGKYTVTVVFDTGVIDSSASLEIIQAPEPVLVSYTFYKDHPEPVEIFIDHSSAIDIEEIRIETSLLPKEHYGLQEKKVVLNPDYLSSLEPGKYEITLRWNDPEKTEISNIQLIVCGETADLDEPYLLYNEIIFKGQDIVLEFIPGHGELRAKDVLALQLDDKLILPDGEIALFSEENLEKLFSRNDRESEHVKSAREDTGDKRDGKDWDEGSNGEWIEDTEILNKKEAQIKKATESNAAFRLSATPSNALADRNNRKPSDSYPVFYTKGTKIHWKGDFISSMGLSVGEHLVGAVFDNSEKTMDLKKVILRIEDESEIPGEEKPPAEFPEKPPAELPEKPPIGFPEEPGEEQPPVVFPEEPGEKEPPKHPGNHNKPTGGMPEINNSSANTGSSGSSGGSGSSSESGSGGKNTQRKGKVLQSKNPDGSYNSTYHPEIINQGGSWQQDINEQWQYKMSDGTILSNTWIADGKAWYRTDMDGRLINGWFLDSNGKWYMLDKRQETLGACLYGWYFEEQDQKWYFLDVENGHMLTGWQFIDGKWYYFTEHNNGQTYFGDNETGWVFRQDVNNRPYGSMFSNETTPDGYWVEKSGQWIR